MSIAYRVAEHGDIPALAGIRAAEWGEETYWIERITGYLDYSHSPQKALRERILYVAHEGATIVGFIAGHLTERFGCDGELEWINVAASHRGSAVASKLLGMLAKWFLQQQAHRICVNCAPENARAYRFYTSHGAVPLNNHWLIWTDIAHDSIVMT